MKRIKKSKYVGVTFDKRTGRWIAQISVKGLQRTLGRYPTELEAHEVYKKAKGIKHEVDVNGVVENNVVDFIVENTDYTKAEFLSKKKNKLKYLAFQLMHDLDISLQAIANEFNTTVFSVERGLELYDWLSLVSFEDLDYKRETRRLRNLYKTL